MSATSTASSFHVLTKPTGAICNLDCKYCFFLSKEELYPNSKFRMTDEVLERYIRQQCESQAALPELTISWQGGEPTLMGLDFFRRSVDLAAKYRKPAQTVPGLVLYRFNASLIFYNAAYFKRRVLTVVSERPGTTWVVVDGAPIVHLDSTGADTLAALADELAAKGVRLMLADVHARVQRMLERSGALERLGAGAVFPTLRSAVEGYEPRAVNQKAEVAR